MHQLAPPSEIHEERVRSHTFATHREVGEDDSLVRREALADPVLRGAFGGRVQHKLLRGRIIVSASLDDEARLDAGQLLGEGEASELTGLLSRVERRNLL